jgi:hypothetical protein
MLRQHLKNWPQLPLKDFQEMFGWEELYARERLEMLRTSPLQFLFTLDNRALITLVLGSHVNFPD